MNQTMSDRSVLTSFSTPLTFRRTRRGRGDGGTEGPRGRRLEEVDGNEERKRLETEPVPDHIRPPRLSAGPSLTPFLTARASGEDGGEEERRKRQRSGQRRGTWHRLTLDLWLAKDNRFLNPKSSYKRILMAPSCRFIWSAARHSSCRVSSHRSPLVTPSPIPFLHAGGGERSEPRR